MLDWISEKESLNTNGNTNYEIKLEKLKKLLGYDFSDPRYSAFRLSERSADISSVNRAVTFGYECYEEYTGKVKPELKIFDISKG